MTPLPSNIFVPPNWIDPLEWASVFANAQPIEVDIGCGRGAFLLWAAHTRPDRNFLGVERLLARLRKVDNKARRLGLANVRLIRLEASYLVTKLIPDASVSEYHILFPDPWPKRRHKDRRLLQPGFAAQLRRTLQPGGIVNVATDHAEYFAQMEIVLGPGSGFARVAVPPLPPEAQTEFELEFVAAGQTICRARYIKEA